jgi:phospholipid/cholesterol/gamma-HCH transport system substrate-binding protein
VADNRESLGTTSDKLAGVTQALTDSLDDVKQFLHVAPNTFQNYVNVYQPAQGAASAILAINNFANPITFICGAVQAASRMGAEQSAKLCVQYLALIIKNRQYNFPPLGFRTSSSVPPRGRTRSPTARNGCGRTTSRRSRR